MGLYSDDIFLLWDKGYRLQRLCKEPTMVPITIVQDGKEVHTTVPVLDVHELLDYVHAELKLCCPMDKAEEYWKHLRDHGQPHAKFFPGTDAHIPFSLFGDECCLGDPKDKVTGIFLSLTLFKPKNVRLGQFLLFFYARPAHDREGTQDIDPNFGTHRMELQPSF